MSNFEYIEEVEQKNYTIAGVTDESYPTYNLQTVYPKATKVIYEEKIYEAYVSIPRPTYYVYSEEDESTYIPSLATYVSEVTFSPENDFENKFIYLDDTDILYEYIGTNVITTTVSEIDFTDTLTWTNHGEQLNGYIQEAVYPPDSPLYWKDLGYINTKRAFDNSNPSQTIADDGIITYVFNTSNVDRIAMFNMDATQIIIKAHLTTQPEDETNTVETVYDLYEREGETFYEILTADIVVNKTGYFEVPIASTQEITLQIINLNGNAAVGDVTLGKANTLGVVLDGLSNDITDYSTYSSDSEATDNYTEGGYRKTNTFTISFPTEDMDYVQQQLESRRGKVTVYNLNPESSESFLKVKGFMRSRPITYLSNSSKSKIAIKIEGRIE